MPEGASAPERLPGSPYELLVTEGNAHVTGSIIERMEPEALREKDRELRRTGAGQEVSFRPQLKDQFGNASTATDDALTATIQGSDQVLVQLPVKRLAGLGAYEVSYTPETCGDYSVHLLLFGVDIVESPVR